MAAYRVQAHSYVLDQQNVLFDSNRARLYVLNQTASIVWDLLSRGVEPALIAEELAGAAGASCDAVARDVKGLVEQWRRDGLIGARDARTARPAAPLLPRASSAGSLRRPAPRRLHRSRNRASYGAYRLLDFGFHLGGDADLAESCRVLLAHLVVKSGEAGRHWPVFEVSGHSGVWQLRREGRLIDECATRETVVPMIHANLLIAAYYGTASVTVVHAAAVFRGERCAMLPARSGSGKSTLTAALAACGFGFCGDDLAALAGEPLRLRPAPLRLGIKSGSWDALRPYYPSLDELPVYRRADNKLIRYLLPPATSLPQRPDSRFKVDALIFPCYAHGRPTSLEPLKRADALLRMTAAGYDRHRALDRRWADTLIAWISELDCYELGFDDMDSAIEAVASVLS